MCGIVYAESFTGMPVNNDILQQFDLQRHRGTQGFGVYDGQELNMVHTTTEDKLLKWLVKYDSSLLLMHHRYPTSTKNVKRAAHPFSTKSFFGDTEYILVHNGVISNAKTLRPKHEERGIEYYSSLDDGTFNDSESLLWDIALTMEGAQESPDAIGRIAFIMLKKQAGVLTDMYFARNHGSPLRMNLTDEGFALSSEGQGDEVPVNTLHQWNYTTRELTTSQMFLEQFQQSYDHTYHGSGSLAPYAATWDDDDDDYTSYPSSYYDDVEEEEREEHWLRSALKKRFSRNVEPLTELEQETMELDKDINIGDVESRAMEYLSTFQGHFEQAYWALECDYETVCNRPITTANLREMRLIERCMEYINADPEYETEESVSSLWDTAWLSYY